MVTKLACGFQFPEVPSADFSPIYSGGRLDGGGAEVPVSNGAHQLAYCAYVRSNCGVRSMKPSNHTTLLTMARAMSCGSPVLISSRAEFRTSRRTLALGYLFHVAPNLPSFADS